MKKLLPKKHSTKAQSLVNQAQSGFTIVEVMLVVAISGLMLIGLIGGSFTAINRQRYNDTLRDFAEYMSRNYSEVIRPSSLGNNIDGTAIGNSSSRAILGRILVFGADYNDYNNDNKRSVYSATLVGNTNILRSSKETFIGELAKEGDISLVCGAKDPLSGEVTQMSSVQDYMPLWDAFLQPINAVDNQEKFTGTMIISRTPTSATVHTAFVKDLTYDLKNNCTPDNNSASNNFKQDLQLAAEGRLHPDTYTMDQPTTICVRSDDITTTRAVQIDANGSNSSAVKTMTEDNLCR